MMILSLIIFVLSLVIVLGLIGNKVRVIRKYPEEQKTWNEDVYFTIPKMTVISVLSEVKEFLANTGHIFVLIVLKMWIKLTYLIKRLVHTLSEKFPIITNKMRIKKSETAQKAVSHFFESIHNYKKRLSRLLDKMREEEHKEFVKVIEEKKEK